MADAVPCTTDDLSAAAWRQALRAEHAGCFACDPDQAGVLGLVCHLQTDGSVSGVLHPQPWMRGYEGRVHGGVIATLLDSAMTQCLFAHGIRAVTATLFIRYRAPVDLTLPMGISARIDRRDRRVHSLSARLSTAGCCRATAEGRFVAIPPGAE